MANLIRLGASGITKGQITFLATGDTGSLDPTNIVSEVFDSHNLPIEWATSIGAQWAESSTLYNASIELQGSNNGHNWTKIGGSLYPLANRTISYSATDGSYPTYTGVRTKSDTSDSLFFRDNERNIFPSGSIKYTYLAKRSDSVTISGTSYTRQLRDFKFYYPQASDNSSYRYYRFLYSCITYPGYTPVQKIYAFGAVGISPIAEVILNPSLTSINDIVIPMRQK